MVKTKKKDLPVISEDKTVKRNDFIELQFTGYANGEVFDSNVPEELKKINPEAKVQKTVIVIGEKMVVAGLDKDLEGKEIGKKYEVEIKKKDAFGDRKRELIRTIPLNAFKEKDAQPRVGMVLTFDNAMARIIAISGARVIADFNNPLSGKDLKYVYTIVRKVDDDKEKAEALFENYLRFVPEIEVKEKVIAKGPKELEPVIKQLNDKFKDLIGKELSFSEKKGEAKSQ